MEVFMSMPRITVTTAVWQRHDLTNYVLSKYHALQKNSKLTGVELSLVAVGSEGAVSKKICESNGFTYVEAPNMPLNEKWMVAVNKTKETNPDALLFVNSDDVVSQNYFLNAYEAMMNAKVVFYEHERS
jgi:hypothetical protein